MHILLIYICWSVSMYMYTKFPLRKNNNHGEQKLRFGHWSLQRASSHLAPQLTWSWGTDGSDLRKWRKRGCQIVPRTSYVLNNVVCFKRGKTKGMEGIIQKSTLIIHNDNETERDRMHLAYYLLFRLQTEQDMAEFLPKSCRSQAHKQNIGFSYIKLWWFGSLNYT